MPGLLQTAEYCRAIFKCTEVRRSRDHMTNIVAVRMIRQQRLSATENPLRLSAVIETTYTKRAARILAPVVTRHAQKQLERDLARLKELVEGESA